MDKYRGSKTKITKCITTFHLYVTGSTLVVPTMTHIQRKCAILDEDIHTDTSDTKKGHHHNVLLL